MAFFGGVNRPDPNGEKGRYMKPGKFLALIYKVKTGETRQGLDNFIVEFHVLKSDNADVLVGSKYSWYLSSSWDSSANDASKFLALANQIDPADADKVAEEMTDAFYEYMVNEDENPLKGLVMPLECYMNKKETFTNHIWEEALDEDDAAEAIKASGIDVSRVA